MWVTHSHSKPRNFSLSACSNVATNSWWANVVPRTPNELTIHRCSDNVCLRRLFICFKGDRGSKKSQIPYGPIWAQQWSGWLFQTSESLNNHQFLNFYFLDLTLDMYGQCSNPSCSVKIFPWPEYNKTKKRQGGKPDKKRNKHLHVCQSEG